MFLLMSGILILGLLVYMIFLSNEMSLTMDRLLIKIIELKNIVDDAVKETPSVIILDKGIPPVNKFSPNRTFIVFLSMILGFGISLLFLLFRNYKTLNLLL